MKLYRAHSLFEIKAVDDEKRIITGIASTPTPDRVGDIVDSMGAEFTLPIPFLWQHDSHLPIGQVTEAKATKRGILITAQIAKDVSLAIDEAWAMIKAQLVRGLSIGFRPLDVEDIPNSWGRIFKKWEWLELSAVTIPANGEANIQTVKSIDAQLLAASGKSSIVDPPGGSGKRQPVTLRPKEGKSMKTVAEQITALEATRAAKAGELETVMQKSMGEGRTTDAEEGAAFDALVKEIEDIDADLARLRAVEKLQMQKAKKVDGVTDATTASEVRGGVATIKEQEKLAPGIGFARWVICLASAKGNLMQAEQIAKTRFPNFKELNIALKAAVEAGTTTDPVWAAPLVDSYQRFAGDFVEFLRPQTIIGKFGTGGVPSLRRVPFNIAIPGQTSGGEGYWVGEGDPKPVTKFDFATINLRWSKVANIAVLTEELIRFSNPSAEALVRQALADALIARLDTDFVDPAKTEITNVSPASITFGVTPIASSGNTADDIRTDLKALFATYIALNMTPANGVWIMPATTALSLSLMQNPLGQNEFPGVTMNGGTFAGLPVIVSEYAPTDSFGATVILVNASDIYLADDGQVVVDASREASLQMDSAPTNQSDSPPIPTTLVSMFQTNSVAIRAERWINWKKRRTGAVAVLNNVLWGNE